MTVSGTLNLAHSKYAGGTRDAPFHLSQSVTFDVPVEWAGVYVRNELAASRICDVIRMQPGEEFTVIDGMPTAAARRAVFGAIQERLAQGWRLDYREPVLVVPVCHGGPENFRLLVIGWWRRP
jgi:hypothetical protein